MVKIDQERLNRHFGNVEDAVEEMMEPYYEIGAGCNTKYIRFISTYEQDVEKFLTETIGAVRFPDGSLKWVFDPCFRNPNWDPFGTSQDKDKYVYPEECEVAEMLFKEFYGDFEQFQKEWYQREFNPDADDEEDEWGYWANPNGFIDYYSIGGRMGGILPIKGGDGRSSDIAKIEKIDFDKMSEETNERIQEWWERYQRVKSGLEEDDPIGINYDLYKMGIRVIVNEAEVDAAQKALPGERDKWPRYQWREDVLDFETLSTRYRPYFEFATYAVVEKDGTWHSKGSVGMFAISSETPEEESAWNTGFFERFLGNEDPDTTIVILDCHC